MNKEEIISLAESMGFVLDYDKFDDKVYPGDSNNLRFLRFTSPEEDLDERGLRWIWYKDVEQNKNIEQGKYIQSRLKRKREVLNSLKY